MKILVVGSGGREHAILWRLSIDSVKHELYAAPGNAGTALLAQNVPIPQGSIGDICAWAQIARPDLVVVGPEAPLCAGLEDALSSLSIPVFGPSKAAARIEGSKQFAKEIMKSASVPTARAEVHTGVASAKAALDRFALPVVIKADGLAAGKGVIIAQSRDEALSAIDSILADSQFGDAGASILIEEFLEGEEASLLALVDGERIAILPSAQDHKRIFDNDMGPNTGGMGAYSPAPVVTGEVEKFAMESIFRPVVGELAKRGISYRGVLYAGLMIGSRGINVLEFNCRFGDPETEAILPRIEGDFAQLLLSCAKGELDPGSVKVSPKPCVTIVLSAPGYPGKYEKGIEISLPEAGDGRSEVVFHAGTRQKDGKILSDGGRVLAATALGDTIKDAAMRAYALAGSISFPGGHYRRDIAKRALDRGGAQ